MRDLLKPAEAILIALLIALALGIWSAAEFPIAEMLRALEPREDQILLDHQVPALQSEAKAVEDSVGAIRAKVLELETELAQQDGIRDDLARAYPGLRALGFSDSQRDSQGGAAAPISPETLQAYLQAKTDLMATKFLEERLASDLTRQIARKAELARESVSLKGSMDASRVESELAACQEQLLSVQKKLTETRLELPRYESRLEAMVIPEPRLREVVPSPALLQGLSSQALPSLAMSLSRLGLIRGQLGGLRGELQRRVGVLSEEKSKLFEAQRTAARALNQRRWMWALATSGLSFAATLIVMMILLALMLRGLENVPTSANMVEVLRPRESILIAGSVILILLLYQAFRVLGAAIGATALALLAIPVAIRAARRERGDASGPRRSSLEEGAAASREPMR